MLVGSDPDLLTSAGGQLSRDALVYGIAIGVALPFGLAGVVIYTRYLSPGEYGHLAILLVASALLTVLYNLPSLMGTIAIAYGASADEDVDIDDRTQPSTTNSGEALTTGALLTLAVAAGPTVVLVLMAPHIADLISGRELTNAVRWAAASAAAGALFRLVLNIPRMEHRPVLYAGLSTSRPAFALAVGASLVVSGRGVEGVVVGLAVGTLAACGVTILATAKSYTPRFSTKLVPHILNHGWRTAPIIASTWTLHNVDLLVLSRYASDAAVGNYRVANRLAAFVLYGASAFLMAMGPVQQTSLFKAAHDSVGQTHVRGLLVRYFIIGGIYTVLLVALAADAMFLLAAPSYRRAAHLVPLIAAGFIAFGLVRVLARTAPVRHRSRKAIRIMSISALCFVPLCFVLIPLAADVGAATAMLVAMVACCAWWARLVARAVQPLEIGWLRVLTASVVATACYGLSVATSSAEDGWRVTIDVIIIVVLCPALFMLTRVVPVHHVKPLRSIVAIATSSGGRHDRAIKQRLDRLDGSDLLQLRKGIVVRGAGAGRCIARPNDLESFVGALRRLGDLEEPSPHDGHIGIHLVTGGTYAESQARVESLLKRGVTPAELYRLEDLFERASRLVTID